MYENSKKFQTETLWIWEKKESHTVACINEVSLNSYWPPPAPLGAPEPKNEEFLRKIVSPKSTLEMGPRTITGWIVKSWSLMFLKQGGPLDHQLLYFIEQFIMTWRGAHSLAYFT